MQVPKEGDYIAIQSYKHDGHLHRTWRETMVLKTSENEIIGCNNHTLVTESNHHRWVTHEPALVYFHKHYWFNIITMLRDSGPYYYCNLATPFVLDREALKYVDYDLDVKVFPDGEKRLLDVDEYALHQQMWHYPPEIDQILKASTELLLSWVDQKKGPFAPSYVNLWYQRYQELLYRG
ncbi:DUF402 domain-containing protein [Lactobacillus sp. DCY120]|uniref:DUF402 domain-containing protein n=1 Tax=Bombilactobacillus apium TaxID=2675299 RepID=A0A850R129_9LACO|nr:DUF402 domain-containing protein [Bombilactobacillus apium]NVY96789.1 DUF402 domain-containing protein [Bombilactobacillus apium]